MVSVMKQRSGIVLINDKVRSIVGLIVLINDKVRCIVGLGLWCLMPRSTIFQVYRGTQFIGGRNRSTWRKPLTCLMSLTNFITICYFEYTSP